MSDLISRQTVFDALIEKGQNSKRYKLGENWELNLPEIIEAINAIPPAESERTEKIHDDKIHPVIHHCGKDIVTLINPIWNYCPCCGKKFEWI